VAVDLIHPAFADTVQCDWYCPQTASKGSLRVDRLLELGFPQISKDDAILVNASGKKSFLGSETAAATASKAASSRHSLCLSLMNLQFAKSCGNHEDEVIEGSHRHKADAEIFIQGTIAAELAILHQ